MIFHIVGEVERTTPEQVPKMPLSLKDNTFGLECIRTRISYMSYDLFKYFRRLHSTSNFMRYSLVFGYPYEFCQSGNSL